MLLPFWWELVRWFDALGTHTVFGWATQEVSLFCLQAEHNDSSLGCYQLAFLQSHSILGGLVPDFPASSAQLNPRHTVVHT